MHDHGLTKGGGVTFDEFLDSELDGLDRYTRVLTGDRQLAHDTLADSLIKVQRHWKKISAMDLPLAYVRRTIANTFLDERRSWARRMLHPVSPDRLPDDPRPSSGVVSVDDRAHLHDLLRQLPRQQRAALVMRHYLDLKDAEIADALSCSTGAVRTYISRGLATLRLLPSDPPAESEPVTGLPSAVYSTGKGRA
jgi:RNA polymerase sigma-70 factor (sigma-E family)